MHIRIKTPVAMDYQSVFVAFDETLFKQLNPPGIRLEVLRFDGSNQGDRVHLRLGFAGGLFYQEWISEISEEGETDSRLWFTDVGIKLPFFLRQWKHNHFVDKDGSHAIITDDIHFRSPLRILDPLLYLMLYVQFAFRRPIYRKIFGKRK